MPSNQRFLALFGPRNSGKTVYLAALYGLSGSGQPGNQYHIAAHDNPDDPTHRYLSRLCRALHDAKWPQATVFDELQKLSLGFTSDGIRYNLVIPDVAGEVTRRAADAGDYETAKLELKQRIIQEFQDYGGFMLFVPADTTDGLRALEHKWEADALIDALAERTPDGGRVKRPVAVVISKWDIRSPHPGTFDDEQAAAEQFFRASYPAFAESLDAKCVNWRVFPTSATGPLANGEPSVPLQSYNLSAPLTWLLTTSDRVRLELAEDYIERHRSSLLKRIPADVRRRCHYQEGLERLDTFLQNVSLGPQAERARSDRHELAEHVRRAKRRWRIRLALASVAMLMSAITLVGYIRDRGEYDTASAKLDEPNGLTEDEVLAQVRPLLNERLRVVGRACGWWKTLAQKCDAFESACEERVLQRINAIHPPSGMQEVTQLLELTKTFQQRFPSSSHFANVISIENAGRQSLAAFASAAKFVELQKIAEQCKKADTKPKPDLITQWEQKCNAFLIDFPDSSLQGEVQDMLVSARHLQITIAEGEAFSGLQAKLAKVANDPWRSYELTCEFLQEAQNREGEFGARVATQRDEFLEKADEAAWNKIQAFAQKAKTNYQGIIERIDKDYLASNLFRRKRADAQLLKVRTFAEWDRGLYEQIRKRALGGTDPIVLQGVRDLCHSYKSTPIPRQEMADAVTAWLSWFDTVMKGRQVHTVVKYVRINRNSRWHSALFDPDVYVTVMVGSSSHSTGEKELELERDETGLPKSELGAFDWKWGDPVRISITCTDYSDETIHFSPPQHDDKFQLRYLNGIVRFDEGGILVTLSCPDAVPPAFPPYPPEEGKK